MRLIATIIVLLFPVVVIAQDDVFPRNNDTINFTHILFEVPSSPQAAGYDIVVSSSKADMRKNLVARASSETPQLLIKKGLAFGRQYYWQYSSRDAEGKQLFTSPVFNFRIAGSWLADSNHLRTTVTVHETSKIDDGYIIIDNGAIITREGKTIWTFPGGYKTRDVRNLQLNKDGNLTFLDGGSCYETNLLGKVLWQGPMKVGKYDIANYHHDIRKLDNGNFLCVAQKQTAGTAIPFDIIFEISRDNEVKWIVDEEQLYQPYDSSFRVTHINSAYLDKEGKYLYISSRDISSVAKVNVQTGKVEYAIGYAMPGAVHYKNQWFNMQHAASLTSSGDIVLFNNNSKMQRNQASSVMILTQPTGNRPPQLVWEYVFNSSDARDNQVLKYGDVQQLPNGNMLVSGGMWGRTFEINNAQQLVWEARHELLDTAAKIMAPAITYRGDFTETLYPCRFIATYDIEKKELLITNTGTVADSFQYTTLKNGKRLATATTRQVPPGTTVTVPVGTNVNALDISSLFNPLRRKSITF